MVAQLAAFDLADTPTVTVAVPPRQLLDPRSPILAWPAAAALPKPPDVNAQVQAKQAEIDNLRRDIASATELRMNAPTASTTPTPDKLQFPCLPTPQSARHTGLLCYPGTLHYRLGPC